VADYFDVVAVGVAHERSVVVGVVLGPDPRLVESLGAEAFGGLEEGAHRSPVGRLEGDVGFAEALTRLLRTIQNSGIGGSLYPMAPSYSMRRTAPRGARTVS
jgi:hypothetical protein